MSIEFKVPQLGEGVDSAEVSQIYVSEGDTVEADQNVMELETEKAVADLPCPYAGKITKIHVSVGDTITVGQTILSIESGQADEAAADESTERETPKAKQEPHAEETAARTEKSAKEDGAGERKQEKPAVKEEQPPAERKPGPETADRKAQQPLPPAGPATRRLARKLGVDLHQVRGSGPSGRITQEDVVRAHERSASLPRATGIMPVPPSGVSQPPLPDFERFGKVERKRLNKVTRTAIKTLRASWATVPHVTQHDLADITELESLRRRYLAHEGQSGPKITLTAIAVKAVTTVLKESPNFNASFDAEREELILKHYYHIGVAVDTEQGLLVPVIRDVDQKTIIDLAVELDQLADRARSRKLGLEDMQGATFTVSNQGGIGGTAFTPIVSFPQVAILGMSRARPEVQMVDGKPQQRLMLPLSLSYDHRVINGADAARFLVRLSTELSDCFQLLIRT